MSSGIFGTIIDGLKYVTNPYALVAYLCLLCVYVITIYIPPKPSRLTTFFIPDFLKKPIPVRAKRIIVPLLFVSTIFTFGLSAWMVRGEVEIKISYESDINIVKGKLPKKLGKRVEVGLIDITTLKTQEYNETLGDYEERERIYGTVFEKAEVAGPKQAARDAMIMNEEQWEAFLAKQSVSSLLIIKHTPFVRFRIRIDGRIDLGFENCYFFKLENVSVGAVGKAAPIVKFRVKHVYNTSGLIEPKAVVVQMVR